MVLEEPFDDVSAFKCEACGLHFEGRETAERCETYCREHKSCNLNLMKQALEQS